MTKVPVAKSLIVAVMSVLLLASCQSTGSDNEAAGTVIGGLVGLGLGALAGRDARPATMMMGAIVGGAAGNAIGRKLDEADRIKRDQLRQQSLEQGRNYDTAGWYNPDSGNSGYVTPQNSYQANNGQYCREFIETVVINGEEQKAYGTACRQPDGSWQIQ